MFEDYETMSAEEREAVKKAHRAVRALPEGRYRNLAWGYVRGCPYRRIERTSHLDKMCGSALKGHRWGIAHAICMALGQANVDGFDLKSREEWNESIERMIRWLSDPSGAIAAPPLKPKPTYIPKVAE